MIWILLVAFATAALTTIAVIASAHRHAHWSADHDLSGPQKMHVEAVPRVGGLGVFAGVVGGAVALAVQFPAMRAGAGLFLCCLLPAFCSGLWEDFTKAVSPRRRLFAVALSALLGVLLLDATIVRTGWVWIDHWIAGHGLMAVGGIGAVFAVSGIGNSINIIDGMNGLASMCVALMMTALTYIAFQVGDMFVASLALATLGASLGFFMWNYPRGLVFLGDGGAYMLGFVVAELGVLLTVRNPSVSMLTPLMLAAYPIFETLFSMYRRKVLRGRPMMTPDGIHLHTLIYRRLMRWAIGSHDAAALTRRNSRTSPYLWVLSSVTIVPATIWWDNSLALALTMFAFVALYLRVYWRIVTFRTPSWMRYRRDRIREHA